MSLIGLVDCNNFFVSCERLFRPDLQQQPVLVLSANDGCVVARSQEVKDMGIPMGVPYFKIKDIVKDNRITTFSGNLPLYRDLSRRVFAVVRSEFSQVEQYSIDEAFFVLGSHAAASQQIRTLRERVVREVGIPVSVGVASSKTLAKFAAGYAKRSTGEFVLKSDEWLHKQAAVSLAEVWGVGYRLARRYEALGLHTVADLLAVETERIARRFGVAGVRLQAELQGVAVLPVSPQRPLQKSLMNSRSFGAPTEKREVIQDALAYHIRHGAAELRSMQASAQTVRVSLRPGRYGQFALRGGSATATLIRPTADTFLLLKEANKLLETLFEPAVPYQKVGVTLSDIVPQQAVETGLFASLEPAHDRLLAVVDAVNRRYAKEAILLGSELKTTHWQPNAKQRSGSVTTRWSDIPLVSAR